MNTTQNGDIKLFAFKPCQKVRGGMAFYPTTAGDKDVQFLLGPTGSFEPNVLVDQAGSLAELSDSLFPTKKRSS